MDAISYLLMQQIDTPKLLNPVKLHVMRCITCTEKWMHQTQIIQTEEAHKHKACNR